MGPGIQPRPYFSPLGRRRGFCDGCCLLIPQAEDGVECPRVSSTVGNRNCNSWVSPLTSFPPS